MQIRALNIIQSNLQKAGRPIKLVAVTKSFDLPTTQALIQAGVKAIGENRVEVAEKKFPHLPAVEKHFIGFLQSKKLKKIIQLFDVIQSVDSNAHLIKMNQLAQDMGKHLDIFLQFNISGETQKNGYSFTQIDEIKKILPQINHLKIIGVMGMASDSVEKTIIRSQFKNLREIRDQLQKISPPISELSMGMSGDYLIALEEGATLVRIGRGLVDPN